MAESHRYWVCINTYDAYVSINPIFPTIAANITPKNKDIFFWIACIYFGI